MVIKHIAHLALKVANLEDSLHFYCDVLGLKRHFALSGADLGLNDSDEPKLRDIGDKPLLVYIKISDNEFLELFPKYWEGGSRVAGDDECVGFLHMSLETDDIKGMYARCKEMGVNIISPVSMGADNTYQCWVADPDGNRVEFMEYTDASLQRR